MTSHLCTGVYDSVSSRVKSPMGVTPHARLPSAIDWADL